MFVGSAVMLFYWLVPYLWQIEFEYSKLQVYVYGIFSLAECVIAVVGFVTMLRRGNLLLNGLRCINIAVALNSLSIFYRMYYVHFNQSSSLQIFMSGVFVAIYMLIYAAVYYNKYLKRAKN